MGYKNPLMKLPAMQKLMALPASPEKILIEQLLREIRAMANDEAERSWRARKGPMAAYYRVVSTYARHIAQALRKSMQGQRPKGHTAANDRRAA